jgi:hypothetical protein
MKSLKYIVFGMSLMLTSCESVLDVTEKPDASERSSDYNILLKDQTGSMQALYGKDVVPGVQVFLKSVTLGTEYTLTSDENGILKLSDVISDKYVISAKRMMSREEMEQLTGTEADFYRLKNSSDGIVDLSADKKDTLEIYLDILDRNSPLVISEIYACGPTGSGLYFHDKYVEIYNQSDSVVYLDGLIIADVWSNPKMGINFIDDPEYIHSKRVWKFPGNGSDCPIQPGESVVCAEDGIDHRINAPNSVDLSSARFEFYKDDAPDIDNAGVANMIKIYQPTSEADWLISGESGALCLVSMDEDSLKWYDDHLLIPYANILDGAEYIADLTDVQYKRLNSVIDASFTGGIIFYTGKSMERKTTTESGKVILKDDNNSLLDFTVLEKPTPGYQH